MLSVTYLKCYLLCSLLAKLSLSQLYWVHKNLFFTETNNLLISNRFYDCLFQRKKKKSYTEHYYFDCKKTKTNVKLIYVNHFLCLVIEY